MRRDGLGGLFEQGVSVVGPVVGSQVCGEDGDVGRGQTHLELAGCSLLTRVVVRVGEGRRVAVPQGGVGHHASHIMKPGPAPGARPCRHCTTGRTCRTIDTANPSGELRDPRRPRRADAGLETLDITYDARWVAILAGHGGPALEFVPC